jgi:hypothetical protein
MSRVTASAATPTTMNGPHREFLLINFVLTSLFDSLFDRFMIRKEGDVAINTWTKMIKVIERIKRNKIVSSERE